MISIHIETDSATKMVSELLAMAAAMGTSIDYTEAVEQPDVQDKPALKPRKAPIKAEEPKEEPLEEVATLPDTPSSAVVDFDVEGVDPTNKDSVRAYLSASIDILTGAVVTQVFSEFGATSFKGIAPEQYAPMIVRLDELRKAAEAEASEKGA